MEDKLEKKDESNNDKKVENQSKNQTDYNYSLPSVRPPRGRILNPEIQCRVIFS